MTQHIVVPQQIAATSLEGNQSQKRAEAQLVLLCHASQFRFWSVMGVTPCMMTESQADSQDHQRVCCYADVAKLTPYLLAGTNEASQMDAIFKLMGVPTPSNWPELSDDTKYS